MTGSLKGDEGLRLALVNHSGAENRTRWIGLIESSMCVGVPGSEDRAVCVSIGGGPELVPVKRRPIGGEGVRRGRWVGARQ